MSEVNPYPNPDQSPCGRRSKRPLTISPDMWIFFPERETFQGKLSVGVTVRGWELMGWQIKEEGKPGWKGRGEKTPWESGRGPCEGWVGPTKRSKSASREPGELPQELASHLITTMMLDPGVNQSGGRIINSRVPKFYTPDGLGETRIRGGGALNKKLARTL